MGDQSEKKRIEKATLWALIGIVATVILGVPAIYFAVHEKQPHISYEIVGDSKVLDVHQPVKELEIRYRGEDIYALKKNLRVLTITIRNDGETHIKQSDFDESMPWGLQIKKGQLVDVPKLINYNSDYIRDNINLQSTTNNLITFQKIIFEREKYFTIEVQLLHHAEDEPEVQVIGKVAGIESQAVVNNLKGSGVPSFWSNVFYGSFSVQLVRVCIFVIGTILLIIILVFLIATIGTALASRSESKIKREINAFLGSLLEDKDEKIKQCFNWLLSRSGGNTQNLIELKEFFSDAQKVSDYLEGFQKSVFPESQLKKLPSILRHITWQARFRRSIDGHQGEFFSVDTSLSNNLFIKKLSENGGFAIRQETIQALDQLVSYLETNELPTKLKKRLLQ